MYKVKVILYNAQKKLENHGIEILSQKISAIDFAFAESEQIYENQTKTRVLSPEDNQKIAWRDDFWSSLSEEHVVISSEEPFTVVVTENYTKVEGGEMKEDDNKYATINANLEGFDEEKGELWGVINKADRKYTIMPVSQIQRPFLQVIKGGKK